MQETNSDEKSYTVPEAQTILPKGSIIVLTLGEFDDYGLWGVARTKKTANWKSLLQQFKAEEEKCSACRFWDWLEAKGIIQPLAAYEVYVGCQLREPSVYSGPLRFISLD